MFEGDLAQPQVVEGSYSTDLFTEKALAWLSTRTDDQPFALFLHFKSTHEPWQYPRHKDLLMESYLMSLRPDGPDRPQKLEDSRLASRNIDRAHGS